MTTLDARATGLLVDIRRARLDHRRVPRDAAAVDLDSAYRIQAELGEGRLAKGYKVVAFDQAADTLLHGRLYADMLLEGPVALGSFLRPRLAVRLALLLSADLPAGPTPGQCHLATGGTFLAVEVTDSVWADGERTLAGEVADNASAGAVAVGERLLPGAVEGSVLVTLDGAEVLSCDLDRLRAGPGRLAWLASETGGLEAGTLVLLGPQTGDEPIAASPGTLELFGPDGPVLTVELHA